MDEIEEQAVSDVYPSESDASDYINMLELDLRYVTVLYYYEDFSVKEIADTLGIPQGTVKSRLMRARSKLLKMMSRKGDSVI